ncbi:hypothetical protein CKJ84_00445 [Corynebacterium sp. NML 120412]|nr:hypothetical protein CKJ84_00445 [Corynebacterium sp. NML 120412]
MEGAVLRERGLEIGTLSPFTMCNLSSSLTDMSDGVSDSTEHMSEAAPRHTTHLATKTYRSSATQE